MDLIVLVVRTGTESEGPSWTTVYSVDLVFADTNSLLSAKGICLNYCQKSLLKI
jgi:hypothetical protein